MNLLDLCRITLNSDQEAQVPLADSAYINSGNILFDEDYPKMFIQLLLSIIKAQGFVKTRGTELVLDDKPFYFGGQNSYELAYKSQSEIDSYFSKLRDMNTSVVRTFAWQMNDPKVKKNENGSPIFFQDYKNGNQVFNDDIKTGIGRFDYVLKSAKDHNLKVIIALSGNWESFGGINFERTRLAPDSKFHSDYFTLNVTKNAFKSYASHFLSRVNTLTGVAYKDDPTIAIIELMNEPRCVGANIDGKSPADPSCTADIITSWATEMSAFVKTIDSNHLLSLGDEGFWAKGSQFANNYPGARGDVTDGTSGIDTLAISKIKDLDVLSIHSYFMTQWYNPSNDSTIESAQQTQQLNNTLQYVIDHTLISKQANKPLYVGEFGHWTPKIRERIWPLVQKSVFDNGLAGFAPWYVDTKAGCSHQEKKYDFCASDPKMNEMVTTFNTQMSKKGFAVKTSTVDQTVAEVNLPTRGDTTVINGSNSGYIAPSKSNKCRPTRK